MGPEHALQSLVAEGLVRPDERQLAAVVPLQRLFERLEGVQLARQPINTRSWARTSTLEGASEYSDRDGYLAPLKLAVSSTFSKLSSLTATTAEDDACGLALQEPPSRGVYLWGGVGCGKTLMMDMLFACVSLRHAAEQQQRRQQLLDDACNGTAVAGTVDADLAQYGPPAARLHFDEFMLSVHQKLYMMRGANFEGDPIPNLAAEMLASHGTLLCFDEMQVTDIADAMLMQRLFDALFSQGAVVVATSNRPPSALYEGGLQRDTFLPFVAKLEQQCETAEMAAGVDYRLEGRTGKPSYFVTEAAGSSHGSSSSSSSSSISSSSSTPQQLAPALEEIWAELVAVVGAGTEGPTTLRTSTRRIAIARAARKRGAGSGEGACRWTFEELCGSGSGSTGPLGPADYAAIASAFHTVVLTNVPALGAADAGDRARRLIVAVDAMYQHRTKLYISAAAPAIELFDAARGSQEAELAKKEAKLGDLLDSGKYVQVDSDAAFAFDRCVSRLVEMQTKDYQDAPHANSAAATYGGRHEQPRSDGAGFLLAFESQTLSEEDILDIWNRYDSDSSGDLDRKELRTLAEDMSQLRSGHRNVSDEQIEATFQAFIEQSDAGGGDKPTIELDVFKKVLFAQGLVIDGVEGTAASRRVHQTRLSDKTQFHVYQGASNADYKSF